MLVVRELNGSVTRCVGWLLLAWGMQIVVTIRRVHVNLPKLGEGGARIANILCANKYILFSREFPAREEIWKFVVHLFQVGTDYIFSSFFLNYIS